jgi:hypothetical protein
MGSCVLPPIRTSSPPPSPVVTFFSVPRRYVKSNMEVSNDDLPPPNEGANAGRTLRKSTRIQIPKSAPYTSPVQRTKEEEQPTLPSPQFARKRNPSLGTEDGVEIIHRMSASANLNRKSPDRGTVSLTFFLFTVSATRPPRAGWWHCQIRNTLFVDKETSVFVRTRSARC